MAKKKNIPNTAYGTELAGVAVKSNHPIRSRYMAAALAIILGILGINHFYLRNVVRGLIMLAITVICIAIQLFLSSPLILIPVFISVLQGLHYLTQSDETFAKKNHVRTV